MKQLVEKAGRTEEFFIDSKATSTEELGNPPYPPARAKMREMGVPQPPHYASQISRADYKNFDLIIGMDSANIRNMQRIFGGDPDGKIHKLREYSCSSGDIADPWYTGDFDITYEQIFESCTALLAQLG